MADNSLFLVMITGQVESADFPLYDDLYCRISVVYGADWLLVSGILNFEIVCTFLKDRSGRSNKQTETYKTKNCHKNIK